MYFLVFFGSFTSDLGTSCFALPARLGFSVSLVWSVITSVLVLVAMLSLQFVLYVDVACFLLVLLFLLLTSFPAILGYILAFVTRRFASLSLLFTLIYPSFIYFS